MEQMKSAAIPWRNNGAAQQDPYTDLASAIVAQAAKDYIKTLRKLWKKGMTIQAKRKLILEKLELERFFHSAWYEMLTDLDPDSLLAKCSRTALEQEKKYRRKQARRQTGGHANKRQKRTTEEQECVHETGQSIT